MKVNETEDLIFFGPGMSNQQMDDEFKKLYDSLLIYKNNIFHLVDTICTDCEVRERLAMNIAERDSTLLQRLVAKECSQRQMIRNAEKKSSNEKIIEGTPKYNLQQILQNRPDLLSHIKKTD